MSTTSDLFPANDVIDERSHDSGEWIPEPKDLREVYNGLSSSRRSNLPYIKSRKIGRKTFSNGGFDKILLRACEVGNMQVVGYLLKIFTQYFSIDTLIDRVFWSSFYSNSRFDKLRSDKVSLLHSAAEGAKLNTIKRLLSAGANVNNPSRWSITPLISALLVNHRGTTVPRRKFEPCVMDHAAKVDLVLACLIDSGADVHHRDADGLTPLMYGARLSNFHAVQILLEAGSDPYAMDNEGCTALHYACLYKSMAVVRHLLEKAPRLILLQGQHSSSCLAPYLAASGLHPRLPSQLHPTFTTHRSTDPSVVQLFLDNPNCPLEIKHDLQLLTVVSQLIVNHPFSIDLVDVGTVQLVESNRDLRIESNSAVSVSSPIAAYENYPELTIEDMKLVDPASPQCQQQLVFQSLLTAERCFGYASIQIMEMISACLVSSYRRILNKENLGLALHLSEMLLFRIQNMQCLTQTSCRLVIEIFRRFFVMVRSSSYPVLLESAISVFQALIDSRRRVSTSCFYVMCKALHFSSHSILDCLTSLDTSDEMAHLVTKFMNSNCPLLVNQSSGYPESLLHIALSNRSFRTLPLPTMESFLNSGGLRWINTPGANGRRPLHLAGTKELALLLVDHGAHLDAVDAEGSISKYSNEYYKSHTRPLSCIVARFIAKTGGIMEHESGLLPRHMQAFISLHDSHATRLQIDSQASECY